MDETILLNSPYYTVAELATRYNVTRNTIKSWVREGRFFMPDGSPAAYQMKSHPYEWRVLKEAVSQYETIRRVVVEIDGEKITAYAVKEEEI